MADDHRLNERMDALITQAVHDVRMMNDQFGPGWATRAAASYGRLSWALDALQWGLLMQEWDAVAAALVLLRQLQLESEPDAGDCERHAQVFAIWRSVLVPLGAEAEGN